MQADEYPICSEFTDRVGVEIVRATAICALKLTILVRAEKEALRLAARGQEDDIRLRPLACQGSASWRVGLCRRWFQRLGSDVAAEESALEMDASDGLVGVPLGLLKRIR